MSYCLADKDTEEDEWLTAGKRITMSKVVVDKKSKKDAIQQNTSSIISRLFHGILRSEVTYTSKKSSSTTFQRFHFIPLDIDRKSVATTSKSSSASRCKVADCLDQFFSSEVKKYDCTSLLCIL